MSKSGGGQPAKSGSIVDLAGVTNAGYQRLKAPPSSLLSTLIRTWSSRWALFDAPAHLLLLRHLFADDLVDGGLHERTRNALAALVALTVVRDTCTVGSDVAAELATAFSNLPCSSPARGSI